MMLMIPRVYQPDNTGNEKVNKDFTPPADMVEKMMKYNEDLANAGALVSLDGLQPVMNGARVHFSGGKPTVTDGPYIETKEVLGGYWIIDVSSKEEAVDWAKRCPAQEGDSIEIRPIFEMDDFPEDVRKLADNPTVNSRLGGRA
jgi:hypothetical protein